MISFNSLPIDGPLRVTSKFGPRDTGIKGATKYHKGVDLGRDKKKVETNLLAVKDGIVKTNAWNDYRGWYLVIDLGAGYEAWYEHLRSQSIHKVSSHVEAGEILGVMGDSSNKNKLKIATHLHFELHEKGVPIDPIPYLEHIVKEDEIEMITPGKINIDGKVIELDRILKDGVNYFILKGLIEALGHTVSYDAENNMPVVKTK